jgi:hypothetical protein
MLAAFAIRPGASLLFPEISWDRQARPRVDMIAAKAFERSDVKS